MLTLCRGNGWGEMREIKIKDWGEMKFEWKLMGKEVELINPPRR